jgi:hypothetical protein
MLPSFCECSITACTTDAVCLLASCLLSSAFLLMSSTAFSRRIVVAVPAAGFTNVDGWLRSDFVFFLGRAGEEAVFASSVLQK